MRIRKIASLVLFLGLLGLQGCEDDPILDPTDGGDTDGGSYGILHFRQAAPDAAPVQGGEGPDPRRPRRTNPHVF